MFTPGPWESKPYGDGSFFIRKVNDTIAFTSVRSGPRTEEDARLIAAAPDLLAACEAFVQAYEHIGHGCWPVDTSNPNNLLVSMKAAIAAARGTK